MKAIGDVGAGHTLGRYELLLPIARGGMAVVWAARMKGSRGFQKLVAIKSMLPSLTDDDGTFEEMFLAEAQLAAQIRHPHVCEILDLGEQDGVLFIVMEWVDGEPLGTIHKIARESGGAVDAAAKARSAGGPGVPIAITTKIGLQVAQGLHAAHELKNQLTGETYGLVHRDVSPQNILITYDGVVKVVDFGVAKATSAAGMGRTAVGQMKGKVTYMAPEQARGEKIDRRADVFSLGIVLYQLVTNRHPFKGETPLKTLDKICDAKPVVPPITYTPTCHPGLNAAIVKALEKDRKKRFETMAEFAAALEGVLAKMVTRGNDLAP
ncbi:MAG TPA: serine/threonine-protein kinase, partial [Minicystis sp.]|nr:serine/threonine-protein kinase [Minicystis sp.]